jgi:6-pyruvoyltetrahydropterin/6-carboxytetrahydropterin synthase
LGNKQIKSDSKSSNRHSKISVKKMPRWKLVTEFSIDSAHYIKGYNGPCGRLHGHTYRIKIEAVANQLYSSEFVPHQVMVADFRTLRWAKQDVINGGLDHCVLNEVLPPEYETTAEMIAQYIYDETKKRLPEGVKLKIGVSETANSWVEYEDD